MPLPMLRGLFGVGDFEYYDTQPQRKKRKAKPHAPKKPPGPHPYRIRRINSGNAPQSLIA